MRSKMKPNRLGLKCPAAASFAPIVLIVLASVVLHGCARVNLEGLPEAVEIAMRRSTLRHKGEIVGKVKVGVDGFAAAQLKQFNEAEQEYGNEVHFEELKQGLNPMMLGLLFKSKREFYSYEIVNIKDTGSLLHHPYEVIVAYKYEVLETKKQSSGDPRSMGEVMEDPDFQKIGEQGSLKLRYGFNADLEWDGRPGIRVWTPPVLAPLARTPVAPPTIPAPGPSPPAQDLPFTITPMGGGNEPPPGDLPEGMDLSPILEKLRRAKSSPD